MFVARNVIPVASLFLGVLLPVAALAQAGVGGQSASGAVVQQLPSVQQLPVNDSMNLNAALARLGRNPRDPDALIDAGQAALAVGDVDAAIGFFRRAEQVTPGNGRIKAGLARALVRSGNPYDALPLFDEAERGLAERGGAMDPAVALDRGLAYDLVADNASAQRFYRQALTGGQNDEATRRLAISLAIAGDKRGSGTTLSPLLMRQDAASWRARAFALAIMGQADEAITVVNGTLPAGLAAGIAPYLRYMPRLTPAQQAAAANFGQFPRASEIGRDDPRVALYAPAGGRRPSLASADAGLIPKGEPLGRNSRSRRDERNSSRNNNQTDRQRPPEVADVDVPVPMPLPRRLDPVVPSVAIAARQQPTPPAPAPPVRPAAPAIAAAAPIPAPSVPQPAVRTVPQPDAQPVPAQYVVTRVESAAFQPSFPPSPPPARPVVAAASPITVPVAPPATPVLAVSGPPTAAPVVQPPTPPSAPVPPTPRRQSLAEAFSDLGRPTADATPASGAVDIRRIRPARVAAAGAAVPAPAAPVHPSRIWVQLATGRDKAALGYDFRRMARDADAAFKNKRSFVSNWGQTNRLLTGPFDTEAAANAFIGQLRRANVSGAFVWTSPAGQVVDATSGR